MTNNCLNVNLSVPNSIFTNDSTGYPAAQYMIPGSTFMYQSVTWGPNPQIYFTNYRPSGQKIKMASATSTTGASQFIFTNVTGFDLYEIEYDYIAPKPSYSTFFMQFSADNGNTWQTNNNYLQNGLTRTSITVNAQTNITGGSAQGPYYFSFYGPALVDNPNGLDIKPENFPGEEMVGFTRIWNFNSTATKYMQTKTCMRLVNSTLTTGYWGTYTADGYWNGGVTAMNALKIGYTTNPTIGTMNLYGIIL
jgi:hypothetical protein